MTRLRALLGAALRRHRHAQQRTLREVAEAAGISLTYLSEIERGRKEASSEVLAALCDALGIVLSALLREVADRLAQVEAARAPVGFLPYRPKQPAANGTTGTADRTAHASQDATAARHTAKAQVIPLPGVGDDLTEANDLIEAIEDILGSHTQERRLLMTRPRPHGPHDTRGGDARILDFQSYHRSRSA